MSAFQAEDTGSNPVGGTTESLRFIRLGLLLLGDDDMNVALRCMSFG